MTTAVHPRVCGERVTHPEYMRCHDGSSPRVRGTLDVDRRTAVTGSVHPRVCGERDPTMHVTRTCRMPVHPRVCGERSSTRTYDSITDGSSPRVRGTRNSGSACDICHRFIPACAGNADLAQVANGMRSVHPRVCGERYGRSRADHVHARFIPACAGNTSMPSRECRSDIGSSPRVRGTRQVHGYGMLMLTVHPRVCGERALSTWLDQPIRGSSPRVRGTRQSRRHRATSAVHPRVCGERIRSDRSASIAVGSSPRVRGTL